MIDSPTLAEPLRDGLPPMPPGPPHEETHVVQVEPVRDLVVGVAEGLTVPFALTAALAAGAAAPPVILGAGLAATAAGAVASGLGGYLAARREAEHYAAERRREEEETRLYPDRERWEVAAVLHRYGVRGAVLNQAVEAVASDRRKWVDFMMRFELDLAEPDPNRAARAAVATFAAQLAGGLIPLLPYLVFASPRPALLVSCGITALALLAFGWLKARATGLSPLRGALQSLALGTAAAFLAWLAARLLFP